MYIYTHMYLYINIYTNYHGTIYIHIYMYIAVGVAHRGQLVAGVIMDPFRQELFWASAGNGAEKKNKIKKSMVVSSVEES